MSQPDDDLQRFIDELRREKESEDSNTQILIPKAIGFVEEEKRSFFQIAHDTMKQMQKGIDRISLDHD